jgi:hypothetical protein
VAYLGVQPLKGQNRKLDDISAGFNGGNVTFNLTTEGAALTPATVYQLFISVGGVLQNPGIDFTVDGNQITFTTSPAGGLSFFGVYQGDAIDAVSVSDGAITGSKLAPGLTAAFGAGSTSAPSIAFNGDTNTGIYSPAADTIGFVEGGTEQLRITSTGAISPGSTGTNTGTTGQSFISQGSSAPPIWASSITSGTAQNTTSGTVIDFTGIPSWVKRVTVMFEGVSTNGSSFLQLQLGTSAGVQSTGYFGVVVGLGGLNVTAGNNLTSGFGVGNGTQASDVYHGSLTVSIQSSGLWVCSGVLGRSNVNFASVSAGSKSLSGTLDRLRLTTVNGTDTFDAGSINILYE